MTDYTKSTNFTAKDSLPEADSGKIIKGSEFDTEFNALQTSIATKADKASPALTGIPTAPTATAGTNTTQLATTEFVTTAGTNILAANNTWTGVQTFKDNKFEVVDNTDATKKLNLELSGVTTATTRTLTVPDKNGTIAVTSDIALADPLNASSNTIVTGSYAVTSSATITITATNTYTAGQTVYIQFTNSSGSSLTNGNFSVVTATGSSFTITYGSSVTSAGTVIVSRYGSVALATSTDLVNRTDTLRAVTSSNLVITRGTALTPTSGTSVSFTGIPSWVRRITVLFYDLTASASVPLIQIGAGSTTNSGYVQTSLNINTSIAGSGANYTTGFGINQTFSVGISGSMTLFNINGNSWVSNHSTFDSGRAVLGNGYIALGGTLDRVIITSLTGSATFSAGTVNIIYE